MKTAILAAIGFGLGALLADLLACVARRLRRELHDWRRDL